MQANIMRTMTTAGFVAILLGGLLPGGALGAEVTPAEARAIAKEAYVYSPTRNRGAAPFVVRPLKVWLFRTDWNRRISDPAAFVNLREDGAHTPSPTQEPVEWLIRERDGAASALRPAGWTTC